MATWIDILACWVFVCCAVWALARWLNAHTEEPARPLPRALFSPEEFPDCVDVVVIGGGPSGSSAALRLARAGCAVLVFEKQPMPRRKLCGGALSEHARAYMDVELPESLVDNVANKARFSWEGRVVEAESEQRFVSFVTRADFDKFLLDQARDAGAQVRFEPAQKLDTNGDWLRVSAPTGVVLAKAAIIAEGATGRFARLVRRPDTNDERGFCLEAEVPLESPDRFTDQKHVMDLQFDLAKHGYGWVFHHGRYYSVGLGARVSLFPQPRELMERYLSERGFPADPEGLKGHMIPDGGVPRVVVGERCLLVGDAGGFVEPFSGEGLAYAIRSGQLAAETLIDAMKRNDLSARSLTRFKRICNREFRANLYWARMFDALIRRYPDFCFRMMAANPIILKRFIGVGQGKRSYRDMLMYLAFNLPRFWWSARKS
jgi:geranylgeranyl reductase family protein